MLDFTSALYLGFRHPSASLAPWGSLTLGRPAALQESSDAEAVAGEVARLQGCEAATPLPSTLHLFCDLFRVLGRKQVVILCDAGTYPIAKWGAERAAGLGTEVHTFAHHDPAALGSIVRRVARANLRPIIVSDGYCPSCGRVAPIPAYAEVARRSGGYLVLDDTQALGILGESPSRANPYGSGGGGSLRWHGTFGPHILVGSSLAKGFGVPLAVLSGSRELIDHFRERSEARIHCSPPSAAVIHAAHRALHENRRHGESLRQWLLKLVARLRQRLMQAGLTPAGSLSFPVQSFYSQPSRPVPLLLERLLRGGIRVVLTKGCRAFSPNLTFLVTAGHRVADIDIAGWVAARAAALDLDGFAEVA
jgi:8-amino-7-oxononanoate synthase